MFRPSESPLPESPGRPGGGVPRGHVRFLVELAPRADGTVLQLEQLQACVGARAPDAMRRRLAFPPVGPEDVVWQLDTAFSAEQHIALLGPPGVTLDRAALDHHAELFFAPPLAGGRAPWRLALAPQLVGGGCAIAGVLHEALAARVPLATFLPLSAGDGGDWTPALLPVPPATGGRGGDVAGDLGIQGMRAERDAARVAGPRGRSGRIADTLRRAALSMSEDVRRPSTEAAADLPLGAPEGRARHAIDVAVLEDVALATPGAGLDDAVLALLTGALRLVAIREGQVPEPSAVRIEGLGRSGAVVLPLHLHRPGDRLAALAGTADPLREDPTGVAARAARDGGVRIDELAADDTRLHLQGCALVEASVWARTVGGGPRLAIGVLRHGDRVSVTAHGDETAAPELAHLDAALQAAVHELVALSAAGRRRRPAA